MSFSLLLHSLDPKPSRRELEEISVKVPSIARADCPGLVEDWFGIVASNLQMSDAMAFQAALKVRGYQTDVVPDFEIPALHSDFRCQRITFEDNAVLLNDAMGKLFYRTKNELVFIAAGLIGNARPRRDSDEDICFRMDLFFSTPPHRISLEAREDSVLFYQGKLIRLRHKEDLAALMMKARAMLPEERLNHSLCNLSIASPYPSMHAYEEELRWAFYRLGA